MQGGPMNAVISEISFPPQTRACARCSHWSGPRRPLATISGVVIVAPVDESARARCGVSSMARSADDACSRFQSAFN